MLKELVRKHSYVPGMTCVEIILYPEFSRSNRQARISGRTMDAGNHRLGYYWQALQHITPFSRPPKIILCKLSVKIRFVYHVPESPRPTSPSPRVPRPRVPRPRVPRPRVPHPRVPRPRVPHPRVPRPRVPRPRVPRPRISRPRVPVPESQSPRPRPTFSDSPWGPPRTWRNFTFKL